MLLGQERQLKAHLGGWWHHVVLGAQIAMPADAGQDALLEVLLNRRLQQVDRTRARLEAKPGRAAYVVQAEVAQLKPRPVDPRRLDGAMNGPPRVAAHVEHV